MSPFPQRQFSGRFARLVRNRRGLRMESLESRSLLASVAVFDNNGYVDSSSSGDRAESDNVQAALVSMGNEVHPFTGITAAAFSAALAGNRVLVIPELEHGDLAPALQADARQVITDFVSGGGTLILMGSYGFEAANVLNQVFGFATSRGSTSPYISSVKTAAASNTIFADGPDSLPGNNAIYPLRTDSLPEDALVAYGKTTDAMVFTVPVGLGSINFLAYDWFGAAPVGGQDGGWNEVLSLALGKDLINVVNVNPDPRTTVVDTIDVLFREAIDPATFTRDDVTLTRDGGANLIDATVSVTRIDDLHYRIGGLQTLTNDLGQYQITVDGNTITKSSGGAVGELATDTWRRKDPPQIVNIIDVSPDPRDNGVTSIDVTFSEPIQLASFNRFDMRLTRDGGDNLITSAVTTSFVSGSTYRINGLFDLTEAPGTYRLVISGEFTDNFNITANSSATETWINNLPPTLSLGGSTTYVENESARLLARGALVSDADDAVLAGGALNVAITVNAAAGDRLRVKNAGTGAGQIGVTPDRIIRYEGVIIGRFSGGNAADPLIVTLNSNATIAAVQALVRSVNFRNIDSNPLTALRTVQFLLSDGDGGVSLPQFKYVNIQRNSGLPQISMGGEPSYTENAAPLVVSPFARLEDPDSLNFDGGKLTVAIAQNADANDRLRIRDQGTAAGEIGVAGSDVTFGGVVIGTLSSGDGATPLEVALNVAATPVAVQALIRNVTFATLGDNPSTALRTLSWVLDDGDGGINSPVLKSVRVLAVNDAAVLTADAGPVGYVNNDPAGVLFASTATVADPDSPNFNHGQLTVAVVRGAVAANRLEIGGAFTRSGSNLLLGTTVIGQVTGNGVGFDSLVINFIGQASRSIVEQLVRSLRFRSVGAVASFERTIAVTVLDSEDGFGSTALVKVAVQSS